MSNCSNWPNEFRVRVNAFRSPSLMLRSQRRRRLRLERMAEGVEERGESGGADEVLGECFANPTALSYEAVNRTPRIAEALHWEAVDLVVPSPWDGSGLQAILEVQVAEHLLERQLWQIVHRLHFGSLVNRRFGLSLGWNFSCRSTSWSVDLRMPFTFADSRSVVNKHRISEGFSQMLSTWKFQVKARLLDYHSTLRISTLRMLSSQNLNS